MLSEFQIKEINKMVQMHMKTSRVPGISITISNGQSLSFCNSYGFRNIKDKLMMDNQTILYIASMTKAFTALSCAMLVERKKLSWNKPIIEYVTSFETADKYITNHATIIDLLSHRTGIEEFPILGNNNISRADLFARLREYKPNKLFQKVWQYNNSMYAIAGHIVELLSGCVWEDFVKENIFTPLQMVHSDFSFTYDWPHENRSKLYIKNNGKREVLIPSSKKNYDTWGPAGSINSNIFEIKNWLTFLLNKGTFNKHRLLSEDNFFTMITPHCETEIQPETKRDLFSKAYYGLGWVIQQYRGEQVIWHNGSFGSFISFMPDRHLGIAILSNMDGSLGKNLTYEIYDLLK